MLYGIVPLWNPSPTMIRNCRRAVREWGFPVKVVECAFGDAPHRYPGVDFPVRAAVNQHAWLKDNLINLGVARLPDDWTAVVVMDCGIGLSPSPIRATYPQRLQEQLLGCPMLHPWSRFDWLLENGYVGLQLRSYPLDRKSRVDGYAWAFSRTLWEQLGGMIDWEVLGCGDFFMLKALEGDADTPTSAVEWARPLRGVRPRAMPDTIHHYWHGLKRNYSTDGQSLESLGFDPKAALKRNADGVIEVVDPRLVELLRLNHLRNPGE